MQQVHGRPPAPRIGSLQRGGAVLPLLGVPVSIKDAFATRGLRTTASHKPLADYVPAADATVVSRLP